MGAVLGMQLPRALSPAFADHFSLPFLLGLVALATVLVVVCRFLWVLVMELVHRDRGTPVLRDGPRHRRRRRLEGWTARTNAARSPPPAP